MARRPRMLRAVLLLVAGLLAWPDEVALAVRTGGVAPASRQAGAPRARAVARRLLGNPLTIQFNAAVLAAPLADRLHWDPPATPSELDVLYDPLAIDSSDDDTPLLMLHPACTAVLPRPGWSLGPACGAPPGSTPTTDLARLCRRLC